MDSLYAYIQPWLIVSMIFNITIYQFTKILSEIDL